MAGGAEAEAGLEKSEVKANGEVGKKIAHVLPR